MTDLDLFVMVLRTELQAMLFMFITIRQCDFPPCVTQFVLYAEHIGIRFIYVHLAVSVQTVNVMTVT